METTPRNAAATALELATAQASFAELGLEPALQARGLEVARLVAQITEEAPLAAAAWLAEARAAGFDCDAQTASACLGAAAERYAQQLAQLGEFSLPADWDASRGLDRQQAETLRKMLLAIAADPKLVVARLGVELVRLRHARELPPAAQQRLAREAGEIYAPLANRLGIWALKWELEDLAFRHLRPAEYHGIAGALAERRIDRERYIEQVCARLRDELARAGLAAEVYGRPKHIYSIWRKMQRKELPFDQVFDVRAVRVVVAGVDDCYAALGVVHGLWRNLPGEFDDYIATPKENDYRSIHTAVHGPEGRVVEVQIRTRDMHAQAELGVAAHWRYKEGGGRDAQYERKIAWARHMLDPARSQDAGGDFVERMRAEIFHDRIYALTPRGEVIDLPRGATPLDFAYHVHTELGHSCRGARVNGRIATLDQPLENGQVVEVITGRSGGPSRDWIAAGTRFLVSSRSRAKVRAWFHQQEAAAQLAAAPAAASAPAATPPAQPVAAPAAASPAPRRRRKGGAGGPLVDIEGVGDMPTTLARCCAPVPPEPVAGYVTLGRGVTVHARACRSFARMGAANPERVLRASWVQGDESLLPVRIRVVALDRRGLLRDVTDVCAQQKLSIDGVNSDTDPRDHVATIEMRTAVRNQAQLADIMKKLRGVRSVVRVERAG